MATVYAVTSGSWSNPAIWSTGSLPGENDDVYSNFKTIFIDNNYKVNLITNTRGPKGSNIARGGYFVSNNNTSLTANVLGGGINGMACLHFLSAFPSKASLYGNLSAGVSYEVVIKPIAFINKGSGSFSIYGDINYMVTSDNDSLKVIETDNGSVINNSTGTLYIKSNNPIGKTVGGVYYFIDTFYYNNKTILIRNNNINGTLLIEGDVIGGYYCSSRIYNSGVLYLTGNVTGGFTDGAYGIANDNGGKTCSIIGHVKGGTAVNTSGVLNGSTSNCYISGTVTGGSNAGAYGVENYGANSKTYVYGTVYGAQGAGILNTATGSSVSAFKVVGNDYGTGVPILCSISPAVITGRTSKLLVSNLQVGLNGVFPIQGWANIGIFPYSYNAPITNENYFYYRDNNRKIITMSKTITGNDVLPNVLDVRQGTVYNYGNSIGTIAIPSIDNVSYGITVDGNTGTGLFNTREVWNSFTVQCSSVGSIGQRLRYSLTEDSAYKLVKFLTINKIPEDNI